MRNVVLRLMEQLICWQCGAVTDGSAVCGQCSSVQPPPDDYYRLFGMERKLMLDANELQSRFYQLSRQLHPDRFTRKSPREQQYSLDAASVLNDGWRILRDPIRRAEYVLSQEGFDIGEQKAKDVPPELLEEVFEFNMALEELREGDQSAREQLAAAREHFLSLQSEIDLGLEGQFRKFDETQDRAVLQEIRGALNRRRYIRNLVNQIEKELAPAA